MRTLKLGVLQKESVLRQIRKTTENRSLDVAKNVWKRIHHLMQQHKIPKKG